MPEAFEVEKEPSPGGGEKRMRSLVQRLKRLWNTPVEFYGVDRPEPQAGSWHGLLLFVLLLVVLGLLWLVRYLPERTVLVHGHPPDPPSHVAQAARSSGELTLGTPGAECLATRIP